MIPLKILTFIFKALLPVCLIVFCLCLQYQNLMNNNEVLQINERRKLERHRVDKNRLLVGSFINVLIFSCAIFSMGYYQWVEISFAVNVRQPDQPTVTVTLWSSLLYGYYNHSYHTYGQLQDLICPRDDTFCLALLYQLNFVGLLCFSIFLFAFLISGYDFYRIVKFFFGDITTKSKFFVQKSSVQNFKNNFRSVLMISTYTIGMSLQTFAISLLEIEKANYGVSFYLFFSSLLLFVVVSLWENRKMSKISRQQLVIKLLEKEKEVLRDSKEEDSNKSSGVFSI